MHGSGAWSVDARKQALRELLSMVRPPAVGEAVRGLDDAELPDPHLRRR
jgi:hypothetical protein